MYIVILDFAFQSAQRLLTQKQVVLMAYNLAFSVHVCREKSIVISLVNRRNSPCDFVCSNTSLWNARSSGGHSTPSYFGP